MFDTIESSNERIYILKCDNIGPDLRLFEENIDDFIRNDTRNIVIDMKEQEIINSLLLAVLIRIKRGLSSERRELQLKNCNLHMYRCIEMSGLESFFTFCDYALH